MGYKTKYLQTKINLFINGGINEQTYLYVIMTKIVFSVHIHI